MSSKPSQRVVFITGCTDGGIGAALALTLAKKGCIVYASSRSVSSMTGLTHDNIRKLAVDVTLDASIKSAVEEIYEKEGKLDVAIANAGIGLTKPLLDITIEQAKNLYETNVFGLMRTVHAVIPRMTQQVSNSSANSKKSPSWKPLFVVIGSIRAEMSSPWSGLYGSSKAAVRSYTETLQMECRPLGINVMLVNPGAITSNINQGTQATDYNLPENSLYKNYIPAIMHTMYISQSKRYGSMDSFEFAEKVSQKILSKNPPQLVRLGGSIGIMVLLQWLPRTWALGLIWRAMSGMKFTKT
ncbi:oxidoreductase [Dendrothele bispora CBS 962.96]|uniref:Oxidoreductase n=1 Tax=Dendrothele bispora (strain CBS 962.96) TaxID=1314807 RepID=A0A4S8MDI7_DENBC|nr:oxidoreductase [Dendrothele bispora CBS 962.96]